MKLIQILFSIILIHETSINHGHDWFGNAMDRRNPFPNASGLRNLLNGSPLWKENLHSEFEYKMPWLSLFDMYAAKINA